MAISVSRSRVKERCGIADSAYDSQIDNLIADHLPAQAPEASRRGDLSGSRELVVVYVEDDLTNQLVVQQMLERDEFTGRAPTGA